MSPLLSICIPTQNRSALLSASLQSIVTQPFFAEHDDIEVVVLDSASTDDTAEVVKGIAARAGRKVRYVFNADDRADRNFETALRHGRGTFLKLINDSALWNIGSIEHLYKLVKLTAAGRPILFFLNGSRQSAEPVFLVNGLDAFMDAVSFQCTWIGGIGVWRDDLGEPGNFSRRTDLKLTQTDFLLRAIARRSEVVICNLPYFSVQNVGRKGGYSITEIFGRNYLSLLREHLGALTPQAYAREKQRVLLEHILPWQFNEQQDFHLQPIRDHLSDYYDEPYFHPAITAARQGFEQRQQQALHDAPQRWRERNPHNETYLARLFDISRVSVGRYSYGPLSVHTWGHPEECLDIGHFVSIADGVQFLLGGNHPMHRFSTYPFRVKFIGEVREATTRGAITVGDDVWIGFNALVMSGVAIHRGAVIAAGSVVTRDVPPYAVVAGNPARVVKFRFPQDIIDKLLTIDYASLSPERVRAQAALLGEDVCAENVDAIVASLGEEPGGDASPIPPAAAASNH